MTDAPSAIDILFDPSGDNDGGERMTVHSPVAMTNEPWLASRCGFGDLLAFDAHQVTCQRCLACLDADILAATTERPDAPVIPLRREDRDG